MAVSGGIPREDGRKAFGGDPAAYDGARPDYPDEVYALLTDRCGLRPGAASFEIGAGPGLATRRLLKAGAAPLLAIEPDPRLAAYLRSQFDRREGFSVAEQAFEDFAAPENAFDLGVCATAFHWLDAPVVLPKIARMLRPGGWWAMWWNQFGDPARPDAFHDATQSIMRDLRYGPSDGVAGGSVFALDVDARFGELTAAGAFEDLDYQVFSWTLTLDAKQTRALYATYSPMSLLPAPERERRLDAVQQVAEEVFSGRVERNMLTPIYTARRT